MRFYNNYDRSIEFEGVVQRIKEYIAQDPMGQYVLAIGTDSQTRASNSTTKFCTAIGIGYDYQECKHPPRVMWVCRKIHIEGRYYGNERLRDKIYMESASTQSVVDLFTADVLADISSMVDSSKGGYVRFEVHIDIGRLGKTSALIKEMMSYFDTTIVKPKIKPESYVASWYANKYTK
jgi:predicted RNase H-related nuclease YkuK (DUF458 family)